MRVLVAALSACLFAAAPVDSSPPVEDARPVRFARLLIEEENLTSGEALDRATAELKVLSARRVSTGPPIAFIALGAVALGGGVFWTAYGAFGLAFWNATVRYVTNAAAVVSQYLTVATVILTAGLVALAAGIAMLALGVIGRVQIGRFNEPIDQRIEELERRKEAIYRQMGRGALPGLPAPPLAVTVATF